MATNSLNVTAGKPMVGGAVHVAPLGTTLPTSAEADLGNAFKDVGYISAEGVKNDLSRSSNSIRAWGGDEVMNIQNEKKDNWAFTMIEAKNENVLKQVFGEENVAVDQNGNIAISVNSKELGKYSWVFDMLLSDGSAKRCVLPVAKITNVAEISYTDSDAVGYASTLNALPDASGNTHYEYITAE
ncbi:MAG: phage tail protein [Erysipelotrichaceae bacterium]|nr:phage tail protein [Erysipelotrichaceae bacterium]